jgi:Fic family protein
MRSVRASNRIEGNRISDEEVDVLIQAMDITEMRMKFGYFEVLDLISESHENNNITENHIKNVHDSLLKYRAKDEGQKGDY